MGFRTKTLLPLGAAIFFTALTIDVLLALARLGASWRAVIQVLASIGLVMMLIGLVQLIINKQRRNSL